MATPNTSGGFPRNRLTYFILGAFGAMLVIGIVSVAVFGTSNSILLTITNFILPLVGVSAIFLPAMASFLGFSSPGIPKNTQTLSGATGQTKTGGALPQTSHLRLLYPILGIIFVLSLTLNGVLITRGLINQKHAPTSTPFTRQTPSSVVPSPTALPPDSASSLIPMGKAPAIDDTLQNDNAGYGWTTGSSATGNCRFVQGQYLLLDAPAEGTGGIDCHTTNQSTSVFSNFVYQIEMTILTGLDDSANSATGPTFRVNTAGTGQEYQVTFDVFGDWSVSVDSTALTSMTSVPCSNPCPYFHTGLNQPNFITIEAVGNSITVQINGHTLGSFVDATYTSGFIGVGLYPGNDNGSVAFNDLRVWQI